MSEFINWEFVARNTHVDDKTGIATFRVGSKSIEVKSETFTAASEVFKLIEKAYKSGRHDAMANVRYRLDSMFDSIE